MLGRLGRELFTVQVINTGWQLRLCSGKSQRNAGDILMMLAQLVCGLASIVRTWKSLTRGTSASCQPPVQEIQLKKGGTGRLVRASVHKQRTLHSFSLLKISVESVYKESRTCRTINYMLTFMPIKIHRHKDDSLTHSLRFISQLA